MTAVLAPAAQGASERQMRGDAFLVTTKVPDAPVELEPFRALMQENRLSHELVPDAPSDIRTFQRVCGGLQTKRGGKDTKGTYVDVTRILSDKDECVYMVTVGTKEPNTRDLLHANAMRVVFDKAIAATGGDPIRIEVVDNGRYEALRELEAKLRLQYSLIRGKVPGSKVRAIYREEFRRMNATRWSKSASVWFVPAEHADKLNGMERVLKALYNGESEFDTLEVIRDEDKLRAKAGDHAKAEGEELVKDLAELIAADSVRASSKQRIMDRRTQLIAYRDRMRAELGGEVDAIETALRLVDRNVMQLMAKKED